ncbi:MAG: MerR family transcriptional regulator [Lachnospiraceae bacterium]|nr:MerR family transcriptional regulator [Lachnospiraceae bacterium]
MAKQYYTIGQLAQLTDMSTKALRIYEEKGLITSIRNEENNYRLFDESVKLQLQRIQTLKYLGFSLGEIEKTLVHFNQVDLEESFLEQKRLMEKKVIELNRMIHCMEKAAIECKENQFDLDEVFKMLKHIIINREADEGVGFLRNHAMTKEPEGWSRWIFEQIKIESGMKILDAGAGYGNLWRYNIERLPEQCRIHCVDKHNTHADTFYKEFGTHKAFEFVWNDLEEMDFENHYDLIFFNHVMVFIEDKETLLRKLKAALKINGALVCTWGGILLYEEMAKLFMECKPDERKKVQKALKKRKQPLVEYESMLKKVFPKVEKRVRKVLLTYDTIEDFIESMKDISNLGFDFAKYEDELKAFIQEKYEAGNYCIERDGYLFICTE